MRGTGWLVGLIVIGLLIVGALQPHTVQRPATDRLGPDAGERVSDYVVRARSTLPDAGSGATGPRWALVSFAAERTPADALAAAGGVRISQVLHRVPIPRVQTDLIPVAVPDDPRAVLDSAQFAASRLALATQPDPRRQAVARVSVARLADGCSCVVGLVVRGTVDRLRDVATRPVVRAVEALPPDAVYGRFAVVPLLPGQTDVVTPGPDDGPVPEP